jgi:stress response protein SCP2
MTQQKIVLDKVNNRLPSIVFGLGWDFCIFSEVSVPDAGILARLRGLIRRLRHGQVPGEDAFQKGMVELAPPEQEAARVLWAQREQLANLDACVLALSRGQVVGRLLPASEPLFDGALSCTGDDITGSGGGDDERVTITANLLPERIDTLALYVESRNSHVLADYVNPVCHVSYMRGEQSLLNVSLNQIGHTGYVVALLRRQGAEMVLEPIGQGYDAEDPNALEHLVLSVSR